MFLLSIKTRARWAVAGETKALSNFKVVFPIIALIYPCVSFNGVIPKEGMKWFIGFQYSINIVQNAVTVFYQSTVMAKINRNNQNIQRHAARSVFILKSLRKKIKFHNWKFYLFTCSEGYWESWAPIPYGHFFFLILRDSFEYFDSSYWIKWTSLLPHLIAWLRDTRRATFQFLFNWLNYYRIIYYMGHFSPKLWEGLSLFGPVLQLWFSFYLLLEACHSQILKTAFSAAGCIYPYPLIILTVLVQLIICFTLCTRSHVYLEHSLH